MRAFLTNQKSCSTFPKLMIWSNWTVKSWNPFEMRFSVTYSFSAAQIRMLFGYCLLMQLFVAMKRIWLIADETNWMAFAFEPTMNQCNFSGKSQNLLTFDPNVRLRSFFFSNAIRTTWLRDWDRFGEVWHGLVWWKWPKTLTFDPNV